MDIACKNISMKLAILGIAAMSFVCCSRIDKGLLEEGISQQLARYRSGAYSGLEYNLHFSIPAQKQDAVEATEQISLSLQKTTDIVLDFSQPGLIHGNIGINGRRIRPRVANNHIIIPGRYTRKGSNTVSISFRAGEQSLNRRDNLLYTLLVPARAHTLFPCFDQPDMKACYKLSLDVPEGWTAIANSADEGDFHFAPTEPLSTYLFAFVAGEFRKESASRGGRTINMYHRETDRAKLAQCRDILDLVFDSLEFMEEYTGVPYPFSKYDLIALPDFQYGGMEHTGATLYNDGHLFLEPDPTTEELLERASLIAHETAHMWFGDLVTMRWFDDVWTKEVFANWFAAKMARPAFPQINHVLGDLRNYYASAYSEDRTPGANAIQRPLDNLSRAGLIYCNTIYDKAPVAMEMLARRMGYDNFRLGVQEYVHEYAYGNACWDELTSILGRHCDFDMEEWSRIWIKEKGMPSYRTSMKDGMLTVSQDGGDFIWPQEVEYTMVPSGRKIQVDFGKNDAAAVAVIPLEPGETLALPNLCGLAYGRFELDSASATHVMDGWGQFDDTARMSLLMTLYENVLYGNIPYGQFAAWAAKALKDEVNPLIENSLVSYAAEIAERYLGGSDILCESLRNAASEKKNAAELRLLCFRTLYRLCRSEAGNAELLDFWETGTAFGDMALSERDLTAMAYELMIRFPERYSSILERQEGRISNPDRKNTFLAVSRAAHPDAAERESLFNGFASVSNRKPEPTALAQLRLLCHPLRGAEALDYIQPALELLPEIQRTGDIFFPANWCRALLMRQNPKEARTVAESFLATHDDLHPLLATKVLQCL